MHKNIRAFENPEKNSWT